MLAGVCEEGDGGLGIEEEARPPFPRGQPGRGALQVWEAGRAPQDFSILLPESLGNPLTGEVGPGQEGAREVCLWQALTVNVCLGAFTEFVSVFAV